MSQTTAIEWCDLSWGPVHGCSKVSPGCAHCYAETLSRRYRHTTKPWTPANAAENVLLKPHKLREPLSNAKAWRGLGDAAAAAGKADGKLVFVNSMSDLFHEQVPDQYIASVFAVMAAATRHTFQVLTKRPERMRDYLGGPNFLLELDAEREHLGLPPLGRFYDDVPALPNVWLGVSIENRRFVGRADALRQTPAAVRFISAEPLLGSLVSFASYDGPAIDLAGIDWLIAGGESGQHHRRLDVEWVRQLRDVCAASGTALFVKQLGGARPGTALEDLPEDLRIREFPIRSPVTNPQTRKLQPEGEQR